MNIPFTFPVSAEAFFAYQEALMNRPITEDEREILGAWIPLCNDSFSAGAHNDNDWLKQKLETMNQLLNEYAANAFFTDFLKATRCWLVFAWKYGRSGNAA